MEISCLTVIPRCWVGRLAISTLGRNMTVIRGWRRVAPFLNYPVCFCIQKHTCRYVVILTVPSLMGQYQSICRSGCTSAQCEQLLCYLTVPVFSHYLRRGVGSIKALSDPITTSVRRSSVAIKAEKEAAFVAQAAHTRLITRVVAESFHYLSLCSIPLPFQENWCISTSLQ